MADELMITPAAEWNRVREGVAMRLPSGRVARIRPFSFESLVRAGRIPDGMVPLVAEIMQGTRDDLPAAETLGDIQDRLAFLDAMVMSCRRLSNRAWSATTRRRMAASISMR